MRKDFLIALLLIAFGFATRLFFFGYPAEVVFDEVHFGNFLLHYANGSYFFDIHPPLGKLLVALFGYTFGLIDAIHFSAIGDALSSAFTLMRLVPIIAGAFLPVIVYFLCRLIRFSYLAAFFVGLAIVFENSLIVESHFILIDSLLLFFGFLSLVAYFLGRRTCERKIDNKKIFWSLWIAAAFLSACAFSVKWTGLSFAGLIFLAEITLAYRNRPTWRRGLQVGILRAAVFGVVFITVYFSFFVIHIKLLPKSGPGDAFMSAEFQKSLRGSEYENFDALRDLSLPQKVFELNAVMLRSNVSLTKSHDYASKWYSWPVMKRPIYYWEGSSGEKIYLLGNPLVYWLSLASIVVLLLWTAVSVIRNTNKEKSREKNRPRNRDRIKIAIFILAGYLINFLPFIFIGRVMFLYHYLAALVFGVIAIGFLADELPARVRRYLMPSITILIFVSFLYFSPLTYGIEPFWGSLEGRFWFDAWK